MTAGTLSAPRPGRTVLELLARLPIPVLVVACLTLGLAPFTPEPHLIEKVRLLLAGELQAPVDVFDLLLHGAPWLLLAARLVAGALVAGDTTSA